MDTNLNDFMSLDQARREVYANLKDGITCPCCSQLAKRYKRKLNSGMARTLIHIYKWGLIHGFEEFVHVKEYLRENAYHNTHDWTLLKYWGMLEVCDKERDDGSNRNGFYRITEKGKAFVLNQIKVDKYIVLYNNERLECEDKEQTNIKDALTEKFDYEELMKQETGGR